MAGGDEDFVVLGDGDVADFNVAGLLPQSEEDIQKIRHWLQPTDYSTESSEYKKHLASYAAGTGIWIQESKQYQEWMHSLEIGALWIKAVPGAGKSVATAHLASMIVTENNAPVLYFFFRQIIKSNRTPQSLVRDWMSQLLSYSPLLQAKLNNYLEAGRVLESIAFDELWGLLALALSSLSRVYCIADALDEMDMGNESFIHQLVQLGAKCSASVKVLVTSRPLPRIETILNQPSVLQLSLQLSLIEPDIELYLNQRLISAGTPSKTAILEVICRKSQGLFLYARLMMDQVREAFESGTADFEQILHKMPNGLGDMYNKMLLDHSVRSGTPESLQVFILQCVTHASRPLRVLEIASIVDFLRETKDTDLHLPESSPPQNTKSIIRAACGPLLEILEDETVSIIHHSFTEFLVDPDRTGDGVATGSYNFPCISFADTHRILADACIKYIRSNWWNEEETSEKDLAESIRTIRLSHPFLDYAIANWDYHLSKYDQTDHDLFRQLDHLTEPGPNQLSSFIDIIGFRTSRNKVCALQIASSRGLVHYVKHLLNHGHDVNIRTSNLQTPIYPAAENGHHHVVQLLLDYGAANDMDDYLGLKPLHVAASRNHHAVVKLLLQAGVDPFTPKTKENPGRRCGNAPRTIGETPLQYACQSGHTETVREFIPFLDAEGLSKGLCWAAAKGKTEVVFSILESPIVEVNRKIQGQTPIYLAARAHDLRSMRKLIEVGADACLKCQAGEGEYSSWVEMRSEKSTPLHVFAQKQLLGGIISAKEAVEGVEMLLKTGCNVNDFDAAGMTVLHRALAHDTISKDYCSSETIVFLLENGADPLLATTNGYSPLHLVHGGASRVVEILIAHGADMNSQLPRDGRTPLFQAIESYYDATFNTLLQHQADCNAYDKNGDTLLHIALRGSDISAAKVETLLKHGADPNRTNDKGETPLHGMGFSDLGKVASLLLDAKADLEAKTDAGDTVLVAALKKRPGICHIQTLLDAGAKVDARDVDGRTGLHVVCENMESDTTKVVRVLIKAGVDSKQCDFAGNTLFHQVARQGPSYHSKEQIELLDLLLELAISPHARNHAGQTPFHIASGNACNSDIPGPYNFLLGPKCNADVNAADYKGVRPIHMAATISQYQVLQLLDLGADPLVVTVEGQSVLQVACRARQSNIVGLLVDLYTSLGQSKLIDHTDKAGKTALHYSCRSGRLESVNILLNAGADPNIGTDRYVSALDMCLQFEEEDFFWSSRQFTTGRKRYVDAAYVTLDDNNRPREFDNGDFYSRNNLTSKLASEHQTVGVRQIVRALVAHGADISFITSGDFRKSTHNRRSTFVNAVALDCEVVVDEFLRLLEEYKAQQPILSKEPRSKLGEVLQDESEYAKAWRYHQTPWNSFAEGYAATRMKHAWEILKGTIKRGEANLAVFTSLLTTENEKGIEEFQLLGADLLKQDQYTGRSCVVLLAEYGFASLLETVSARACLTDDSWLNKLDQVDSRMTDGQHSILLVACHRKLPNLEVIKVLVEKLHIDINRRALKAMTSPLSMGGSTVLHLLAHTAYWWHTSALEYCLQHGADTEIKDDSGSTPLHIAAGNKRGSVVVEILLRYGANPNVLDNDETSCLNNAGSNSSIVRQLIEHGADILGGRRPFIFDAIATMSLDIVDLLVEKKADLNVRQRLENEVKPDSDSEHDSDWLARQRKLFLASLFSSVAQSSYPVHYAACETFRNSGPRSKMIPIIKSLLRGGADSFLPFNSDGDLILHNICEDNGILEPFLDLALSELETRDARGRTPLLAACSSLVPGCAKDFTNFVPSGKSSVKLLLEKGVDITATDAEGRNVLHAILARNNEYDYGASKKYNLQLLLAYESSYRLVVQKDAAGRTPFHYALQNKKLWAVDTLLAHGADPLQLDPEGNTALHLLAANWYTRDVCSHSINRLCPLVIPLFHKFISLGNDVNSRNNLRETPIFLYMAHSSNLNELALFEKVGADFKVKDINGQNVLHIFAKHKYVDHSENTGWLEPEYISSSPKTFKWLMDKGLDPWEEDKEQRSSLDLAAAAGKKEILEMFKRVW
jgi:ankyrin repeat protein